MLKHPLFPPLCSLRERRTLLGTFPWERIRSARLFLPFKPYFYYSVKRFTLNISPFACFSEKEGASHTVLPFNPIIIIIIYQYHYDYHSSTLASTPEGTLECYFTPSGKILAFRRAFESPKVCLPSKNHSLKPPHKLSSHKSRLKPLRLVIFF
jgi:hypothetical protein